jgi:DNA-binding response OmpR family regulator
MPTDPAAPVLLYVEDEILIQITILAALEDAGFHVLAFSDGAQALAFLATAPHGMQGLITDVNLGDGPDGWDVAQSARALVSDLPVIYVSSAGRQDWTLRGVRNSLMITKPCLPSQAVVAMTSLFANPPGMVR